MIRVLHTADWHVGKTLSRRSRLDETRQALKEVVEIARSEEVDVVLVCGDVYEHQAPPAECEALVYETLLELEKLRVHTLLIPGNHDDAGRWKAVAPLLARCAVTVVPEIRRPDSGGVVDLKSRDGRTDLQVAALPWVHERRLGALQELMGAEEAPYTLYADSVRRLISHLCARLDPGKCSLLAAHVFIDGSLIGGGERSLTVGQTYAVTAAALPHVQYAALGHVHRPQRIPGSGIPAHYAGSLLQLDFGEREQQKSVCIVDLEPRLPARIRAVELKSGRRLRDVRGPMDALEAERDNPDESWLRVFLECAGPSPGLAERVRELLPNALEVRLDYPREEQKAVSVRGMSPREQFRRHLIEGKGAEPDTRLLDLFEKLLEDVR